MHAAPRVQSLLRKIQGAGCALAPEPVVCEDIFGSTPAVAAYDCLRRAVVLNPAVPAHALNQREWTRAITHELIHAYDHCRVAALDYSDCAHMACTEVRAANLSGDCDLSAEVWRTGSLPVPLAGHQQACVRRRAEKSIAMHPACAGRDIKKAVDDIYAPCYADRAPFLVN